MLTLAASFTAHRGTMPVFSLLHVNAVLGSAVVTVGAWLAWNQLSLPSAMALFAATTVWLIRRGKTMGLIWAWSTLFLGIESFVWPIVTMTQIRSVSAEPSDEQMGMILSALVMGLFSAVFWLAFSYGLFRRAAPSASSNPISTATDTSPVRKRH